MMGLEDDPFLLGPGIFSGAFAVKLPGGKHVYFNDKLAIHFLVPFHAAHVSKNKKREVMVVASDEGIIASTIVFFLRLYLGCGFKHFLCSPLPGDMIQFDQYFLDGLKPPTNYPLSL